MVVWETTGDSNGNGAVSFGMVAMVCCGGGDGVDSALVRVVVSDETASGIAIGVDDNVAIVGETIVSWPGCCISISPVSWGSTIMLENEDDDVAFVSADRFMRGMDNGRDGTIINRDKLLGRCGGMILGDGDDDNDDDGGDWWLDMEFEFVTGISSIDMDRT